MKEGQFSWPVNIGPIRVAARKDTGGKGLRRMPQPDKKIAGKNE